jgi:hypothetical protein
MEAVRLAQEAVAEEVGGVGLALPEMLPVPETVPEAARLTLPLAVAQPLTEKLPLLEAL